MLTDPFWIKAPDVIRDITAGADVGLAARRQALAEQEAAAGQLEAGQRLRLAYDTLAAQQENERRAAAQNVAKMLFSANQDSLANYFEQQRIKNAADAIQQRQTSAAARLKSEQPVWVPESQTTGPGHWESANHIIFPKSPPGPSAFDKDDYQAIIRQEEELQKAFDSETDPDRKQQLQVQLLGVKEKKRNFRARLETPSLTPLTATAPSPQAEPNNWWSQGDQTNRLSSGSPQTGDSWWKEGDQTNYVSRLNQTPEANSAPALTNSLGSFKAGARVVQNGVTYQFDGTNWNPVK